MTLGIHVIIIGMATGRQPLEVVCITIWNHTFVANHQVMSTSLLNFSVELGAVRLLMLYDCKLNGRLSSNVDGHMDNYLLILCSMPLCIIVRLVFN